MSRFSKAGAEAKGWVFVHEREEHVILESGTQNRSRTVPATLRAEKYVSRPGQASTLINEEGETMGKLLERIYLYEEQQERFQVETTPLVSEPSDATPLTDAGTPQRTVIVADEREDLSLDVATRTVSEEEWAARDRTDTLITEDEDGNEVQTFYSGASRDAARGVENTLIHASNIENRRAAEAAVGSRKQLVQDPSRIGVDAPGATGTGTVIVREDEEDMADALARKAEIKEQRENERVLGQRLQGFSTPVAPEGAEALAGVDVGIQERGDLGSEIPPVGAVVGNTEFGEPFEDAVDRARDIHDGDLSEPASAGEAEARTEAEEEVALEQRDENPVTADEPEQVEEVREAGIEAAEAEAEETTEQGDEPDGTDSYEATLSPGVSAEGDTSFEQTLSPGVEAEEPEQADQFTEKNDVEATDAAKELAAEQNVDLSKIKGTGKDGRVTKPDVEAELDNS
jgi:hypothetical protein